MKNNLISCSIVIYNENLSILNKAIKSFLNFDDISLLYIIDHSPSNFLQSKILKSNRIVYIFNPENPGFGAGHNTILSYLTSEFHLILNPDINFNVEVLIELLLYMKNNKDIGVIMPKITYPDGEIQYLAKLLPRPIDFLIRRFIPIKKLKESLTYSFELRKSNYNQIIFAPFLSGCFMIIRTNVFIKLDGFDNKIFMYTEDIDLCRRVIKLNYKTIFYPNVSVIHDNKFKSFMKLNNLIIYIKSAIYYFNKWGWFFDQERIKINKQALDNLN